MCRLLAVHRRGPPCPSALLGGSRGLTGFHPCAFTTQSDRGLRGPHHREDRLGSFLLNTTTPVVFPAASPVRLSLSASPRSGFFAVPFRVPRRLRRDRRCCLFWVVQRSPLHRSTVQESSPSPLRDLRGGGCHRALARPAFVPTSPFSRPRRLAPPARYRACTRPRSWGSPRFPQARLSPRPRSPPRVPALRSLPPRSSLPPSLTR